MPRPLPAAALAAMCSPRRLPRITHVTTDGLSSKLSITCDQFAQSISAAHAGNGLSRSRRSKPPPPNGMFPGTATSGVLLVIFERVVDLEEVDILLAKNRFDSCACR